MRVGYDREYICTDCGLIWFTKEATAIDIKCECGNHLGKSLEFPIYACDTMGWYYMSESVVKALEQRGKRIHYHENHPWFYKNGEL